MTRDNIVGTLHSDERIQAPLSVGGGVSSYNELTDLPTVNGHEFIGDMTSNDLGIWQPKDFSTTEQNTGLKWIDGKDIFVRTFDKSTVIAPDNAWSNNILGTHGTGINIIKDISYFKMSGQTALYPYSYYRSSGVYFTYLINDDDDINIRPNINAGVTIYVGIVTIYYTKN